MTAERKLNLLNVKSVKSITTKVLVMAIHFKSSTVLVSSILFAKVLLLVLTTVFISTVNIPDCSTDN